MTNRIQDEIMDIMAKDLAKGIDEDIMLKLLKLNGWITIEYFYKNNPHAVDVTHWLIENCQGQWHRLSSYYVFEDKRDAVWFKLRWE